MPRQSTTAKKPKPRPLRGAPEETRARLVRAAAKVFARDGYDGTDSNKIAREAGYSPGTFYKHFVDKRQVFLAVYEEWVTRDWRDVSSTIASAEPTADKAERIVHGFLEHHRRWRGFRASLRALVSTDPAVREFYREQRRRQLALLKSIRDEFGGGGSREADALLLFTVERTADAFADGEVEALKVRPDLLRALLVDLVRARLESRDRP
jgi:AcrR family transcriptional regulator